MDQDGIKDALESFFRSSDFEQVCVKSMRMADPTKLHLYDDGTWGESEFWESDGISMTIPALDKDEDEFESYIVDGGMTEDEYLSNLFLIQEHEVKVKMRNSLSEIFLKRAR